MSRFKPGDIVAHYRGSKPPMLVLKATPVGRTVNGEWVRLGRGYTLQREDDRGSLVHYCEVELSFHPRTLARRARLRRRRARLWQLILLQTLACALVLQASVFCLYVTAIIVRGH